MVFLLVMLAAMVHPLVWVGYVIAGLAGRRLRWALLAGVAWAFIVTLVFGIPFPDGPIGVSVVELVIYRFVDAMIIAAALFFARRAAWRLLRRTWPRRAR